MVNNFICKECEKFTVCSWSDQILKFDSEQKRFIPVDLTLNKCPEFKEVE
jgi:hypothetical protein